MIISILIIWDKWMSITALKWQNDKVAFWGRVMDSKFKAPCSLIIFICITWHELMIKKEPKYNQILRNILVVRIRRVPKWPNYKKKLIKANSIQVYGLQDVSFITYSIKFWYVCVDFKFAGKLVMGIHTMDNSRHVITDEYCYYLRLEDWVHALYNHIPCHKQSWLTSISKNPIPNTDWEWVTETANEPELTKKILKNSIGQLLEAFHHIFHDGTCKIKNSHYRRGES